MRRTRGAAVIGAVMIRSWPSASCRPTLMATSPSLSSLTGSMEGLLTGLCLLAFESWAEPIPVARSPPAAEIGKTFDPGQGQGPVGEAHQGHRQQGFVP